jgi:hypothetical protein
MKKIKAKASKPNIKEINYKNYKISIDFNRTISVSGYVPIMGVTILNDGQLEIITGVIDKDLNFIVPLREKVISKQDLENKRFGINIILYSNAMAFYETKEAVYLIDLKTVKFSKENGEYIPNGYYLKMKSVLDIGDDMVIIYLENKAFLYDVINNEIKSMIFNYIRPSKYYKNCYDAFIEKENVNVSPLSLRFTIKSDFELSRNVILNEETVAVLPDSTNKKEDILKYCDDCYNSYFDAFDEEAECKRLH